MNKNRLEAFSDGVLAIVITIMVLEIRRYMDKSGHFRSNLCVCCFDVAYPRSED